MRKPNYDQDKRRKEAERKAKKDAKRAERQARRDAGQPDEPEDGEIPDVTFDADGNAIMPTITPKDEAP